RAAAGADLGPRSPGFSVGGTGGGPGPVPLAFDLAPGGSLTFPVRGYEPGTQRGDRALSATAEYRVPLALVERGFRLLPVFLDRVWGDVFADAGGAWCPGECERGFRSAPRRLRPLYSVGAELGVDATVGYFVGMTLRGGVAVPLSEVSIAGGMPRRPSPELYLRFGRSF
ncbi:MAG TPA: hypothetical protein VHG28_14720, partial [Longimicrobiaceae bacterium]|nr:hypothetical protein [Longimicrobiaceae bacterium]